MFRRLKKFGLRTPHNPNSLLLSYQDSNLDRLNQNQLYYHYTIGQSPEKKAYTSSRVCKYRGINANLQMKLNFTRKISILSTN